MTKEQNIFLVGRFITICKWVSVQEPTKVEQIHRFFFVLKITQLTGQDNSIKGIATYIITYNFMVRGGVVKYKIFVDGQEGTTGLKIHDYLSNITNIEILKIDSEKRKDYEARKALLNETDVVFLCLPDTASRDHEAAAGNDGQIRCN